MSLASAEIGRMVGWAALGGAALYGGLVALLYFFQDRLVYVPYREMVATPAEAGLEYEAVSLRAGDGVRLAAWWVPAEKRRATLLFCHGNAGNISYLLEVIRVYRGLGLDVLVFDYRGYGESEGSPSEEGTYRDARAAWAFLVDEKGIPPAEIVVCGRSLGGPIAAWLARREAPGALFLESTFTSIPELGEKLYPFLPVRWLSRYNYSTRAHVGEVECPVLVVHSRGDGLIPFAHGRELYEAAPGPKAFAEIEGGHGDGYSVSEVRYRAAVDAFLREHLRSAE